MRVLDGAPRPQSAIDCAAVAARCGETVTGVEFYRDLEGRGFELGPRLRRIAEIRRRCGEALATLDQPPGDDPRAFGLPATLFEVAAQLPVDRKSTRLNSSH